MDYSGAFPVIKKQYGPFFYIHALHSHVESKCNLDLLTTVIKKSNLQKTGNSTLNWCQLNRYTEFTVYNRTESD